MTSIASTDITTVGTTGRSHPVAQFPGRNESVETVGLTSKVVLLAARCGVTAVEDDERGVGVCGVELVEDNPVGTYSWRRQMLQ